MGDSRPAPDALRRAEVVFCRACLSRSRRETRRCATSGSASATPNGSACQATRSSGIQSQRFWAPRACESMRPHVEAALAGQSMERDAEVHHKTLGTRWVHVDCVPTFDSVRRPRRLDRGDHRRDRAAAHRGAACGRIRAPSRASTTARPRTWAWSSSTATRSIMMYANRPLLREFEVPGHRIDLGTRWSSSSRPTSFASGCRTTGEPNPRARR